MERPYPKVFITPKGERALRGGHPWVFEGEVTAVTGACENGAIADVYSQKGRWLGAGYYNDNSKIRVRLLSRNPNDRFDAAFYERRLRYAVEYRRTVMGDDFSCCRLIFGEADTLPGLTVDRYENILVAQVLSLGVERVKDQIFPALVKILAECGVTVDAVYERNDVALRGREGMAEGKGFYAADGLKTDLDGFVTITENGLQYRVDYVNGQKTGFFLDQKYNRLAIRRLARGRTVLDCFTHTGAFALNAAAAGAERVTAVDVSADALAEAEVNRRLNGLDNVTFQKADVFDLLTDLQKEGNSPYDFIILDPPAFTKSSATVQAATRGYKEINRAAMRLLPRGGYLATCSCSHFMTDDRFRAMLDEAAADAAVSLRQIAARAQAPDHPVLRTVPETDYLKFYLFQVV